MIQDPDVNFIVYDSVDDVVRALAEDLLEYSLADQLINISLSGGSTPQKLFDYLANSEFSQTINWCNLHFWWGDERCVEQTDDESNFGAAYNLLFQHIDIPGANLHRIQGEQTPQTESDRLSLDMESTLAKNPETGLPQFNWVILGVGEDGHTASLFPGQTDYDIQLSSVVTKHPENGQFRISITAPVICSALRVTYLVLGAGKAKIVSDIVNKAKHCQIYPAANIHAKYGITEWFLDPKAASTSPALFSQTRGRK